MHPSSPLDTMVGSNSLKPTSTKAYVNLRLRLAIALKYQHQDDPAPKVVASGQGFAAQRLIETAQDHAIPIHQDADLAEALAPLPAGQFIPPELYAAVAEVLAMLVRLDASLRNSSRGVTFARPQ